MRIGNEHYVRRRETKWNEGIIMKTIIISDYSHKIDINYVEFYRILLAGVEQR